LTKKTAQAFAPAAISSFFEICDTQEGKPITDLEKAGAKGGGFGLQKGVLTRVTTEEAQKNSIKVALKLSPKSIYQKKLRFIYIKYLKLTSYNIHRNNKNIPPDKTIVTGKVINQATKIF